MGGDGVGAFAVGSGGGVVIDMIAELIAQGDGVGVIVVGAGIFLVGVAGVESRSFIDVGITVPITGALGIGAAIPIKGIAGVEHGNAIDKIPNCAQACQIGSRMNNGHAGNAVEDILIFGEIGEGAILPRSHDVGGETRGPEINPIRGGIQFLNPDISGCALRLAAVAPGGQGGAGGFHGVIGIDAGITAGIGSQPGIGVRVRRAGAGRDDGCEEQGEEKSEVRNPKSERNPKCEIRMARFVRPRCLIDEAGFCFHDFVIVKFSLTGCRIAPAALCRHGFGIKAD